MKFVMEKKLSRTLPYRHIKEPTTEILRYIDNRRHGVTKSLKTRWKKFNRQCMGGIEANTIYTIAGVSGAGKSSFVNSLECDLVDLNPKENFIVLSFNFEMLSSRQVGRKFSYKMKKTTYELYSGNTEESEDRLSDEDYDKIVSHAQKIKQYPVYYVDVPGTVDGIGNTITHFQEKAELEKKWLVIILDHTLLTRGRTGEQERETLYNLQRLFMEVKKYGRTTIIQVSQMNRNIESSERIVNLSMHYPKRSDLFGSDSLFQASDYVIVLHRPELLGIKEYGLPSNGKPVKTKGMIFMHFLKAREGEPKILRFINNLKHNSLEEPDPFNHITKGETNEENLINSI